MQELFATTQDGRAARAARTRAAVVDALLDLIYEGHLRPSAALVAQRAGVSLRSVFQHFDDLETLFHVAGDRHRQRFADLEPLPELPAELGPRVAAFVAHRARWLEATAPMARAATLQQPFSRAIAERHAAAWARQRDALAAAFGPELARAPDRARLLPALEVAASWNAWETMRTAAGLTPAEAAEVLQLTLLRLLGG